MNETFMSRMRKAYGANDTAGIDPKLHQLRREGFAALVPAEAHPPRDTTSGPRQNKATSNGQSAKRKKSGSRSR